MDFACKTLNQDGQVKTTGFGGGTYPTDNIVKTVKVSGGDFSSIQSAVSWFASGGKVISGACFIDVDPGVWSEYVDITGLFISGAGNLTIRGDQRLLAGMSWVDSALCNSTGVANGGAGEVNITKSGNDIYVSADSANPNFAADGWGSGDKILVRSNSTTAEYTISSTSSNTITLTTTAPTIGNDGTAVCLLPNRKITSSVSYPIRVLHTNVTLSGFQISSWSGGVSVLVEAASYTIMERCAITDGLYGAYVYQNSFLHAPCSFWNNSIGVLTFLGGACYLGASYAVGNSYGYYATRGGNIECDSAVVGAGTSVGLTADMFGYLRSTSPYVRMNGSGKAIWSRGNSLCDIRSGSLNAATNYDPAVSPPGFGVSATDHGVIYAN